MKNMKRLLAAIALILIPALAIAGMQLSGVTLSGVTLNVPPPPPTSDSFMDSDGTLIENHVGDTGINWVLASGTDNASGYIYSNKAIGTNAAKNARYYNSSYTPPSANYEVEAVFTSRASMGASDFVGLCARMSTTEKTYYIAQFYNGNWDLLKVINGTQTLLDTTIVESWDSGVTKILRLRVNGTTIELYVDDILKMSGTNSDISAAGFAGFQLYGTNTTTSVQMDDWTMRNL